VFGVLAVIFDPSVRSVGVFVLVVVLVNEVFLR